MKKMKRLFCFLLAFTLTFGCMSTGVFAETGTRPADGVTEGQPFAPGTGGSSNFRIPCLVSLDNGTLVAACDARWNHSSDACGLDTIVSRSKDNGATWRYTFANYLGDNGNAFNYNSTAFIDPAIATDGETVYMIADLYPAGIAINTTPNTHRPLVGSTGFDENDNLILAAATDEINGLSPSADRISQSFNYHLEKNPDEYGESYYLLKDAQGNTVEGYVIDAFFNIRGEGVDTNIFCGDSPYYPWPADYLYMTKSSNGGRSWSEPKLLNLKKAEEQTLLVGPGRGIYTSSGRILFTCYEFTNTDKNSACIYSDDGGETWQRGESVSGWSSEAVVTEADGKIYMFTRHGNCYYVSQDNGTTWSSPVSVPKAYNSNCQLTAITYSEKIDGKTAILLAAPSSTSARQNGKIFVGLVQEDGTISWDYEYEINKGGATYAYSCLTELVNGELGLLYESAGSAITYKTIAIEDVAKGAAIGDLWLEKEGNPVTQCDLTPDGSAELTLMGIEEGVEIQAESSNPDAVTVSVSGNTVTITGRTVTGLAEADITITAGGKTTSLKVYVTASLQYEIVDLHMGETKTYRDKTGDYSSADLSGVDTDVARVTVTGDSVARQQAQLATADATFDGDTIEVDSCLYTFEEINADEHTYKISGKAGETTVYVNLSGGKKPNSTTEKTVKILAGATAGTFKLQDLTGGSNGGAAHLHFYSDNLSRLYYDRCGTSCGVKDEFEFYTPSDNAPADSPVQGYAKVSSLSDITNGGRYLIVRKANDNNYYIMHPANNAEVYNYVAKVVEPSQETGAETGNGSTEITIEAVGEGNTSATIGNVTYYIRVANVVKNIQLELEETYSVPGTIQKSGDSNIVTSEEVAEMPPYTATEEITAGKYLIGRGAYIVTDSENTSSTPQGLVLKLADYEEGSHADSLWTVAQAEGGYTLQGTQGKYMTFSGQNILMSDTPQTLTFANCAGEAGKTITGNGTNWLNQWGGDSSTLAAGWTQANNGWVFYVPAAGIKLTGTTVGTTTMTIGNVNYNITVVEKTTPADYTKVNEAIAEAEALNRGNYVSFDAVDDAIEAVVTGLRNTEQDRVDAMAKAITDAIGALELKSANYRAVDAAIMAAEALDRDAYKDLSAVDAAVEAVVRGKDITEQSAVDAMAQAITDAIAALEPWSGANYAGVEAAIARANGLNPDNYVSFDAVTDAINEAEKEENQNLLENEQERVDAMADAINAAIDALVLKDADYTEVNEAIEKANGLDEELYKDFSAVEEAIAKVVEGKNITEQSEVDAMAQAIKNAIAALEYKDADYSKVDAAIEKSRNLNVNLYKDFSGVEAAIAAVSKDKNITEQSEVDAMAKAIEDAIIALEYKDADYNRVDAAIETANKLIKANYKDFSKVEAAIAAVVRGKDITEQSGVDAMAKAITDAIAALEPKESETPGSSGGTSSGSQSSTGTSDKPTEVIPATGSQSSQTASQTNSQNTASNAGTAQTGDNAQTGLYVALLLIAAAAVGGVIFYKKKDKKDNK